MIKKLSVLTALLVVLATLTACGNDEDHGQAHDTKTAAGGSEFNDADVAFATDMMQHHAQALVMVDMTMGRKLDPVVKDLVEAIRTAQAPEIEQMTDWLTEWDQPVPETARDHANAHGEGDMEMDPEMPGMMSADEMAALEAADGAEFERMWLEMMIEHHEGAVEMAKSEQAEGVNKDAIEMAKSIESSQQDEIATMEKLLAS
ncbi:MULTISPECIES: DUF305 domain-containing protein [unclassified Nocardioides]|uniref:DUF305 domain-containing protein n=1 Tax=unclassified Nocardioides TaxID=2615069 RepID=UPI0006FBDE00|nr:MULTISPECIES: DUF305 domain-containing protein [unclassified Nocardioides]KQY57393.1 hypothetical protein ASD30_14390 [Nocardioides sp. Root140]KQZ68906.1 hypothetical protein ASD66_16805 [Nocardioides sp. Root151]KRF20417.1 hypothetical protein ASH02_22175 [Nocardioides sp. Soil796]